MNAIAMEGLGDQPTGLSPIPMNAVDEKVTSRHTCANIATEPSGPQTIESELALFPMRGELESTAA